MPKGRDLEKTRIVFCLFFCVRSAGTIEMSLEVPSGYFSRRFKKLSMHVLLSSAAESRRPGCPMFLRRVLFGAPCCSTSQKLAEISN